MLKRFFSVQALSSNSDEIKNMKDKEIDELRLEMEEAKERLQSEFESKVAIFIVLRFVLTTFL